MMRLHTGSLLPLVKATCMLALTVSGMLNAAPARAAAPAPTVDAATVAASPGAAAPVAAYPGAAATGAAAPAVGSPAVPSAVIAATAPPPPPAPPGGFADSHLDLFFRHYAENFNIDQIGRREAWIQSVQVNWESGYTDGPVGLGLDVSPFAAVKLNGGKGARNLGYLRADGSGQGRGGWAYLGRYDVKARLGGTVLKYGLQALANPMLSPYDIRALPPTFRGLSLVGKVDEQLAWQAGSFDAVNARGDSHLRPLTSTEGGVRIARFDYVGGDWSYAEGGKASAYVNRARDLWDQYYATLAHSVGQAKSVRWTGGADFYYTRDQGRRLQGAIDNKAYSLSLAGQHGASTVTLGYQRIVGPNYFDYVQETNGIYLANSVGVDYNAPDERSLHVQYKWNGEPAGFPGWQVLAWRVNGWGMDAAEGARRYAAPDSVLHGNYWKNGQPVGGDHHELGFKVSKTVGSGVLRNAKVTLVLIKHAADPGYPGRGFYDHRLLIDFPLRVF
ncbi:MAG: OprD family outer membrane porin [Pseudomonadota bacterium]